jgi:signal transduction histidine kinase
MRVPEASAAAIVDALAKPSVRLLGAGAAVGLRVFRLVLSAVAGAGAGK